MFCVTHSCVWHDSHYEVEAACAVSESVENICRTFEGEREREKEREDERERARANEKEREEGVRGRVSDVVFVCMRKSESERKRERLKHGICIHVNRICDVKCTCIYTPTLTHTHNPTPAHTQ